MSNPRPAQALRVLQISPFHPEDFEMGGPLNLIGRIAASSSPGFTSVGIVSPTRRSRLPETGSGVVEHFACQEFLRYRTAAVTSLTPLLKALSLGDVVLIHGYRHWLPLWAAIFCRMWKIPYVVHLHGMANREFRSFGKKWLFDRFLGPVIAYSAAAVVCSSEVEKTNAAAILPDLTRVELLPHGIPDRPRGDRQAAIQYWRGQLDLQPDRRLVLTLGRISPSKNYEAAIRAMRAVDDAILLVVGPVEDSGYWEELQRLARQENTADRVRFLPGVYGAAKDGLLQAADAFLTTSHLDSFSMVVAEAAGNGTPVIYPSWIGIAEYLQGQGFYPLDNLDEGSVSAAIQAALSGPRVSLDSLECLSWPLIIQQYDTLFRKVYHAYTSQSDLRSPGGSIHGGTAVRWR